MKLLKSDRLTIFYFFLFFFLFMAGQIQARSLPPLTISGTVTGLNSGQQITLFNNGTNSQTITSNTQFTFNIPIVFNGSYNVTIGAQPTEQICTILNNAGTGIIANVNNVSVVCNIEILHSFNNADGRDANTTLALGNDDYLYGTTSDGGINHLGTIFKINPTDASYQVLRHFAGIDGEFPTAGLVLGNDGFFYGATLAGGSKSGTIFKINPINSSYVVIHQFSLQDGMFPAAGLTLGSDGCFYGTTTSGGSGSGSRGTLFKINPADNFYVVLHSFIESEGSVPAAGLVLGHDGHFYGTTSTEGKYGSGTVFRY